MKFSKKTFSNGLRAIVAPMEGTDTVTVLVLIGTGSNYEKKNINGLSHFLEHMFFKGTKKYPKPGELDRQLDAIGAIHNAFTSREVTGYWIKADAKHAQFGINWVSEILQDALLKEEEIDRERGVILEEMSMIWDDPMRYIWSVFEENLYGDHPYGWDVIGTAKNIHSMKRSAFLQYWKSQYVASNTVVVVAGKVSESATFAKIEKAFAGLRTGKFEKAPEPPRVSAGPRVRIFEKDTAQSHVLLGTTGFHMSHKDKMAAGVLATILGGYMSSRLFMDIRERRGLAYAVRAVHEAYRKVGYFAAYAGTPHAKAQEVVQRIVENLARIRKGGVTNEELTRAKDNAKGRLAIALESTDEVAGFLGEQEILLNKLATPEELERKIDKVSKEDINRIAKKLFRTSNSYLTVIGPHQSKDVFIKLMTELG
ncbi:MAG: pitrilysin family protein [Patescibacteria group bacterium]